MDCYGTGLRVAAGSYDILNFLSDDTQWSTFQEGGSIEDRLRRLSELAAMRLIWDTQ